MSLWLTLRQKEEQLAVLSARCCDLIYLMLIQTHEETLVARAQACGSGHMCMSPLLPSLLSPLSSFLPSVV